MSKSDEPFDVRLNDDATIDDISAIVLGDYLGVTENNIRREVVTGNKEEVLREMGLLSGSGRDMRLKNVAVMMFCEHPEKFFPGTYVRIIYPEGSGYRLMTVENVSTIEGPVWKLICDTMNYLKYHIMEEHVLKLPDRMETLRYWSYPESALHEAVVNALLHRDYGLDEPVTVEIYKDHVDISSFPGIDKSISDEDIERGEGLPRSCKNAALRGYLKQLKLVDDYTHGFSVIQRALDYNGSERARIICDEERTFTRVRIPLHIGFTDPNYRKRLSDEAEKRMREGGFKSD